MAGADTCVDLLHCLEQTNVTVTFACGMVRAEMAGTASLASLEQAKGWRENIRWAHSPVQVNFLLAVPGATPLYVCRQMLRVCAVLRADWA